MKNTSSKLKWRSHRIASKLEFSNTQDNPIEIEEAEDEVSMHREEIVFTDESKKQGSLAAFKGGHSFNDLSESEDGHFSTSQGSIIFLTFVFHRFLLSLPCILKQKQFLP